MANEDKNAAAILRKQAIFGGQTKTAAGARSVAATEIKTAGKGALKEQARGVGKAVEAEQLNQQEQGIKDKTSESQQASAVRAGARRATGVAKTAKRAGEAEFSAAKNEFIENSARTKWTNSDTVRNVIAQIADEDRTFESWSNENQRALKDTLREVALFWDRKAAKLGQDAAKSKSRKDEEAAQTIENVQNALRAAYKRAEAGRKKHGKLMGAMKVGVGVGVGVATGWTGAGAVVGTGMAAEGVEEYSANS